jgi:ATP-binding cassette subfamily B protein
LTTTIVVIGGAFFVLAPSLAWMAVLPMPLILLGSVVFQKLLAPFYSDVLEKVGLLNIFR